MPKKSLLPSSVTDKLLDIYSRFSPSYIQKSLNIPASTFARFQRGEYTPSKSTIKKLFNTVRNSDRKEMYDSAKRAGFSVSDARKISSKSRSNAVIAIKRSAAPERARKRVNIVSTEQRAGKTKESLRAVSKLNKTVRIIEKYLQKVPTEDKNEKRVYIYALARKNGLTAAEARDIRNWSKEKAEKYIIMREGGAMVMHAKAAAEGSLDFVSDQNIRYNRVAEILSKIHNVPIEHIKRGMSINYSKERTVDDWEEYVKEKHGIKF